MSDVAIVTAIYDEYDTLKPVLKQTDVDVEWILVTDKVPDDAQGWTVVHEPRPGIHPNRAAKRPKCLPWEYTDAPLSIWVDASFRVINSEFARTVVRYADPIAQFIHPWRDCLFDEADASAGLAKYAPAVEVTTQRDMYRAWGHPEHWGLWATGVIARQHTSEVQSFGHVWLRELYDWTFQDQISQPYALRTSSLRPSKLPGTHLANHWVAYEGSGRHG
jgi:hypothetical protein